MLSKVFSQETYSKPKILRKINIVLKFKTLDSEAEKHEFKDSGFN